MISNWIKEMDFTILNWIHENLTCEFLDKLMPVVSFLGNKGWFFVLIAVILLCIPKYRKWGASLATALIFGFVFGNMLIKNAVARIRPYDQADNITLLVDKLSDFSFPSGHTLVAFELFGVLCMLPIKKLYKVLAGILAFLMAFSRLYLYVHFPSDVIAGMGLGFLFGIMGVRIVNMIDEEQKLKKQLKMSSESNIKDLSDEEASESDTNE